MSIYRQTAPAEPEHRPERRAFMRAAGAAALAAAGIDSSFASSLRGGSESDFENMIVVNTLGQLLDPNVNMEIDRADGKQSDHGAGKSPARLDPDEFRRAVSARSVRDAHRSGLTAVNVTLAGPDRSFEQTLRQIGAWDQLIHDAPQDLAKILTAQDILDAKAQRRVGVIYGFQNGAPLANDLNRIDTYADFGVRIYQLTYNPANQLGGGAMASPDAGLSAFGTQVIERLNARRIIIDLSHSGERTCMEAARASARPIAISHTGCRAVTDLPCNKTDQELRLVASKGGYVGIYFMAYLNASGHATAEDVVAHIDHAVNVCGEDHVGIGTDGSVTPVDDLAAFEAANGREIARRRAAGIASTERADTFPFVVDLRGVDQFRKLFGLLQRRGYTTGRIEKILGANFLRHARTVWGA